MSKRPDPGKCIHCLQQFDELTWDHVFPDSWYPDTTPDEIERWQVPACGACNERLGKIEDKLKSLLVLCMDPTNARASGISEKTLRAFNPNVGHSPRDKEKRMKRLQSLMSRTTRVSEPPTNGVFPGFGPQSGVDYGAQYNVVWIPADLVGQFDEKIIRGLTYVLNDSLIESEFEIAKYHVIGVHEPTVDNLLERGATEHRGPGFEIHYVLTEEKPAGIIMKVIIWGTFVLYGVVQLQHQDSNFALGRN